MLRPRLQRPEEGEGVADVGQLAHLHPPASAQVPQQLLGDLSLPGAMPVVHARVDKDLALREPEE
eukprot:10909094-Alexandrium_andersonii.AAC.1